MARLARLSLILLIAIPAAFAASPSISTSSTLPPGTVSVGYSFPLAAKGGTSPYTWTISSGSLPPGLALSAAGVISGTPTADGNFSFSVKVTDKENATATKGLKLKIRPPLVITTSSLADGAVGASYSQSLAATGGAPPYVWSVASGSTPPGLVLQVLSGTITGTPTAAGTFSFTIGVSDVELNVGIKAFTLEVAAAPLAITTASPLPQGSTGAAYSQALSVNGGTGPYSWSILSGALPAGLALGANGTIAGTPTNAGTFSFMVQVRDSASHSGTKNFSLTIGAAALSIAAANLGKAEVGLTYSQTVTASGGKPPYTWTIAGGALPNGLSLAAATGVLSGVPVQSGPFSFTIRVRDSAGTTAQQSLQLTVAPALSIDTAVALPEARVGTPFSFAFSGSGGVPPYTWSAASVSPPPGMSFDGSGRLSGSPTSGGQFTFGVQLRDSYGASVNKFFTITVRSNSSISISPTSLPEAALGANYTQSLSATGGTSPYTWSIADGNLPSGLALTSSGLITGTPNQARTFFFTIRASDSEGNSATQALSITVTAGLTITTAALPNGVVGASYSQTLKVSGGKSPYSWSITTGSLPPGLALKPSSGDITGKPTAAGDFSFTMQVSDGESAKATRSFTVKVTAGLTITTESSLPPANWGVAYSAPLAATGGLPPYTWSIESGSMPAGLTLNPSGGSVTGSPATTGNFAFTIRVTDSVRAVARKDFSIAIERATVPQVTVTGISDTAAPAQQLPIDLTMNSTYPAMITGRITMTFAPDAVEPVDDQAVQFVTGGRTADFTVLARTTQAIFATSQMALQTGTVSGTITLHFVLQSQNSATIDFTRTIVIPRTAPVIRSVTMTKTSAGFEISVTGFSSTREVTEAHLHFTPAASSTLTTRDLTVSLTSASQQWFRDAASAAYGSQFILALPFTITGGANQVGGVSVELKNTQGTSQPASATF